MYFNQKKSLFDRISSGVHCDVTTAVPSEKRNPDEFDISLTAQAVSRSEVDTAIIRSRAFFFQHKTND